MLIMWLLYIALCAYCLSDAWSTSILLQLGNCYETNPLMDYWMHLFSSPLLAL